MKPLLSVHNLKTYFFQDEGTVKAVDGVSFNVPPGKTVGVVGESGCGKSMTARSILRILQKPGQIVSGQIFYRFDMGTSTEMEYDLTELPPQGRLMQRVRGKEIALIFQEPMSSFSPVHTIGAQIMEAILLHRDMSKHEAHELGVNLLKWVGISLPEQRMGEYPHQLSGGLRQRAMIAMALSCDPRLLIADEPTTAIDVTTQAQVLDLLTRLQQDNGMAILFITHNLGVIAELADEVVVMYLGKVAEKAAVDDIFHAPKHPYTKALLRSIPSITSTPRENLPTIRGSIPHPYNRPSGCTFHSRCDSFMPGVCDVKTPKQVMIAPGREVSCFLYHSEFEEEEVQVAK